MIDEDGSAEATELWATADDAISSVLAYSECRSALAAAQRVGRLSSRRLGQAVAEVERLRRELVTVGVDMQLAVEAGELAAEQGLRGYDAVHLATALSLGGDTVLVSWDRDLLEAAQACGLAVAPASLL